MAQPGSHQASLNAGEIGPELHGRTDIKQFYSAASLMKNTEPVPQGGGRLSPRTRHRGRVRNALAAIAAGSPTLTLGPHAAAATVIEVTFTAPAAVSVVEIPSLSADVAFTALLQVQLFVGGVWTNFGSPQNGSDTVRTLTAAAAPRAGVTATAMRLRLTAAATDPVTFTGTTMSAFSETADKPTAIRARPFTFSIEQTYIALIAPGIVDFWRSGVWVGAAKTSLTADQVVYADPLQRLDTLMLFKTDIEALRILRDGADGRWPLDTVPFTNIPQVDLGDVYTNAVSDIWKIYIRYPGSGTYQDGKSLNVSVNVNGEETAGIATGNPVDWATFATDLQSALEGLPSIEPGLTVTQGAGSGDSRVITVEFTGDGNFGTLNSLTAQVVNTAEAAATVTHFQLGVAGGEDLISADAGYAACAKFFNDRLVIAGFLSKKSALLASVSADYFNLNTEIVSASGALLANVDTDGAEEIHQLARARHLLIFTTDAEYFVTDRAISRTAVPNIVNCSRNGSARGVPVVESEGSVIYVSRNRAMVYAMGYDDVRQAYISDPISLLASHIVSGIVDAALQRAEQASDANRYWLVRDDGTMTLGVMIINQDVVAFVRWETSGIVKTACVDGANVAFVVIERAVGSGSELHFEQLESGLIFDDTVEQTFEEPTAIVTGLPMHEGAVVWAKADDYLLGPFTVAGGAITLPDEFTTIAVGRWTAPDTRLLPLPNDIGERVVLRRPKRIHTIKLDLIGTTSVAVGANGEDPEDVPLYFAGDPVDQAPAPFTGLQSIEGLTGISDEGIAQVTQVKPGWLQWRGITVEAKR